MAGLFAVGGLEVSYKADERVFVLHAHICAVGATTEQIEALRAKFSSDDISGAFEAQPMKDPAEQISYLLKFADYHRPGRQVGPWKPPAFPLPNNAFLAWACWMSAQSFENLTFLMGARRVGRRIKPMRQLARAQP